MTNTEALRRLREAREARDLTQGDVAEMIGYKHRASYTNVENGRHIPSGRKAWKLFRLLGISPIDLREGRADD